MLLTTNRFQAFISKKQKQLKFNYLSMICNVKMFLAKTKGLQKYGINLHKQGFFALKD